MKYFLHIRVAFTNLWYIGIGKCFRDSHVFYLVVKAHIQGANLREGASRLVRSWAEEISVWPKIIHEILLTQNDLGAKKKGETIAIINKCIPPIPISQVE